MQGSIKYLGINVTNPLSNLYAANLVPLIDPIHRELVRMKFYLSWTGRLAAFKMILLPRILYFFRTLPICIPEKFYHLLQGDLSKFVWLDKKPRCSNYILRRHKKAGGMGIPILKDYQMAAMLDELKCWTSHPYVKLWCNLEQNAIPSGSFKDLLIAALTKHTVYFKAHPLIEATVTALTYYH